MSSSHYAFWRMSSQDQVLVLSEEWAHKYKRSRSEAVQPTITFSNIFIATHLGRHIFHLHGAHTSLTKFRTSCRTIRASIPTKPIHTVHTVDRPIIAQMNPRRTLPRQLARHSRLNALRGFQHSARQIQHTRTSCLNPIRRQSIDMQTSGLSLELLGRVQAYHTNVLPIVHRQS